MSMSTLELNKIIAAILTAGVIAMASGFIAELLMRPHELEENVYVVAGAEGEAEPAMAAESAGPEPVLPLLAAADPGEGEAVAKKCTACHTFEEGGANKIGPNLYGVVGRPVASHEGFGYSAALQGLSGETWSYENLNHFIAGPKAFAPGTKMAFAGIAKVGDRAALVAYLRGLSGSPEALPSDAEIAAVSQAAEAEAAPAESQEAAAAATDTAEAGATQEAATGGGGELATLLAAVDSEAGAKVFRKCAACHTVEAGGPNKLGPNLHNIIGRQVASHEGYSYSGAMSEKSDETWSYESLDSFLAAPKDVVPGTKMAFAGLSKAEDRAAVIAYLRQQSDNPPPLPQ